MKLLLLHQNFPGQFRYLAHALAGREGCEVRALGLDSAPGLPGVKLSRYRPRRAPATQAHGYLHTLENAVLHGQQVARILLQQRRRGYRPDVILGHPGWGETLFLKDVFPDAPLIHFCEYYYQTQGADAGFDPEFPMTLDDSARLRLRNTLHLLNLEQCDWGVTPTYWQHSLHPEVYRGKIRVAHEGIPVNELGPDPLACLPLPCGGVLRAGQPVVTYVARNLEPYRGFHSFMRALPSILSGNRQVQVVIVGGDGCSYGRLPGDAPNWRSKLLGELSLDLERVHFLGKVPYATYRRVLQVSAVHVYLTYPFVLSWSLLEAMASGCLVVGSDTAPVREVIEDGRNGHLVDFFSPSSIASRVLDAVERPAAHWQLRQQARATAQGYSVGNGLKAYGQLLADALGEAAGIR
ncbi:glycosyltransferase family 4 protein [Pseudomonas sp. JH-2]|uniref:glycosyltransferase family 4 protein n=1 Tax=Pseudomonas sp. JH-2 TaxID=3114998 RepID=UPI002E26033B|nr:glycosyltransferase family 4 protein [Pseudomonas sp. JH-2]